MLLKWDPDLSLIAAMHVRLNDFLTCQSGVQDVFHQIASVISAYTIMRTHAILRMVLTGYLCLVLFDVHNSEPIVK